MRDQMSFYRVDKLGNSHLSRSIDKLDWTEVQKVIHETFRVSVFELTVFSLETTPKHTTSGDHNTPTDLKRAKKPTLESIKYSLGCASNLVLSDVT